MSEFRDFIKNLPVQDENLDDILIIEDTKNIRALSNYSKDTLLSRLDLISRKIRRAKATDKLDLISDKISLGIALLLSK